jgi:hypothetical protein
VLPYWLLFSVFAAGAVQYQRRAAMGRHAAPLLGVLTLIPLVMVGMRYEVGADWEAYTEIYSMVGYLRFGTAITMDDPGYALVNWVSYNLGFDLWFVNLVCAAIFSWGLWMFARRQPNPWLAFVVAIPYLVIVVAMGYSRQAVAIGFIMAAITAWDRRLLVRFGIYILLAVTFHKTAVLAVPLIALSATQNRMVTGAVLLGFSWLLYRYFLSESVDKMLVNYVEAEYNSQGAAIRVGMNLVPALLYLAFQRRFALSVSEQRMWRYFSFATLGTVVMLVVLASSTVVDRIALYLIPLQLFVLSRLPEAFPTKHRANVQLALCVILYSALIQFVWLNYAAHAEYWLPYKFWT